MTQSRTHNATAVTHNMEHIRIFTTGGTIDKIYFDAKSTYEVGPSNIAEILHELNAGAPFSVTSVMQKDSLELDDADRLTILEHVKAAAEKSIVITHGTDTMVQTAQVLAATAFADNKTVVLTGALAPALFRNTDAIFNIGGAMIAAQSKPAGCYIVMNGRVYNYNEVRKDREANRFVPLDD